MPEITMPQLSDTMTEGTVVKWHKKEGDKVREGDKIADVETDKAVMEMESFESGVLSKILVKEGEKVQVGSPLARRIAAEKNVDLNQITGTGPGGRIVQRDVESAQTTAPAPAKRQAEKPREASAPAASVPQRVTVAQKEVIPLSKIRGVIA